MDCKEKTKRTKGYTLIITYYKLTLILGPYKNFDFVNNMNKYKIERLVRNRELPIMKIVKELLGGKKNGKES